MLSHLTRSDSLVYLISRIFFLGAHLRLNYVLVFNMTSRHPSLLWFFTGTLPTNVNTFCFTLSDNQTVSTNYFMVSDTPNLSSLNKKSWTFRFSGLTPQSSKPKKTLGRGIDRPPVEECHRTVPEREHTRVGTTKIDLQEKKIPVTSIT